MTGAVQDWNARFGPLVTVYNDRFRLPGVYIADIIVLQDLS